MEIRVNTKTMSYPVILERGVLARAKEVIGREGHVYLISETGVPLKWREMLQKQYPDSPMYVFEGGESSKNLQTWKLILEDMLAHHVSRKDTVIALGGGVTGDMAGFAAASYMRGIPYINIPTTSLSQIDSSIGGKTAVDLAGAKNCVGAFWQPDMVLVDPEVLTTLSQRHLHNGFVEAVKEGLTFDPELFEIFEHDDYESHVDEVIEKCLRIKKRVVEEDERETGERKKLNFGHTYGHAFETYFGLEKYYHGECVGLGMLAMMNNPTLVERLRNVLIRMNCPVDCTYELDGVMEELMHDKKADHHLVTIVQVDEIGKGYLQDMTIDELREKLENE